MSWIQYGIENPLKSEVIDRCGGEEKTEWPRRTDKIFLFYFLYWFYLLR